jgi:transcriptional regulator with XRE-family HTH domain
MPNINIPAVQAAMKQNGLSGRKLAERLQVSPQTITNWLSSSAFPHPTQLLKLALNLRISFEELVLQSAPSADEPRVAARARMNRVLSDATLAELKGMGKLLEQLAPYLPFDTLESAPRLVSPSLDRDYLQQVSKKVRSEIGLNDEEPIRFQALVEKFSAHNAVLIPVLWGKKEGHENAIHVFLPKSGTTWVYLNLDTYLPDFKFWMAHELGHVYSPSLSGSEAEKFADAFAGALLFPRAIAAKAYDQVSTEKSQTAKIRILNSFANKYGISSYSVFKETNSFALSNKYSEIKINASLLHAGRHNSNKELGTLSDLLWKGKVPAPSHYVDDVSREFKTVFFETLTACIEEKELSASFVQAMLDIPLLDAKALHSELAI